MGVSMNSKRSYIDSLNAGRERRSYASLEQLNRSLETLEQRIEQNRDEAPEPSRVRMPHTQDLPYGRRFDDGGYADERRGHAQPYQSIPTSRSRATSSGCADRRMASPPSGRSPAS
jgi:localization factor PodJL